MRRTGMSFQRTRLSADRRLMSIIRTSVSLIGFGFTIFQACKRLQQGGVLSGSAAPRNFGESLVWLGIGMLILGIIYHVQFMYGLRIERQQMAAAGLVHAQSKFPTSLTLNHSAGSAAHWMCGCVRAGISRRTVRLKVSVVRPKVTLQVHLRSGRAPTTAEAHARRG
jgi:putative membrane protein